MGHAPRSRTWGSSTSDLPRPHVCYCIRQASCIWLNTLLHQDSTLAARIHLEGEIKFTRKVRKNAPLTGGLTRVRLKTDDLDPSYFHDTASDGALHSPFALTARSVRPRRSRATLGPLLVTLSN